MPKLAPDAVPSYRIHKQSGQAIVTLNGRDFLLGRHGSAASRLEYNRLVAEWLANDRQLPASSRPANPTADSGGSGSGSGSGANGRAADPADMASDNDGLTVNELILRYWRYAKTYYRKHGRLTSEVDAIKAALQPLKQLYGHTSAAAFRPLALQAVRRHMVEERRWTRRTVNHQVARIKRMYKWAVARELVPADRYHGLCAVDGLRRGRSAARETEPVQPVPRERVTAAIAALSPSLARLLEVQEQQAVLASALPPSLPLSPPPQGASIGAGGAPNGGDPAAKLAALVSEVRRLAERVPDESPVAAMIAIQWLTGMRPGELIALRDVDVDRGTGGGGGGGGDGWVYRPATHKTEHFGHRRLVPLGPRARQILAPFLRPDESTLAAFSPRLTVIARRQARRAARRSKVQPSQVDRSRPRPHRAAGDQYTVDSYRRAIAYACKRAGVPAFAPNQLRHSCGTSLRHRFGLEAARVVLGHSSVETTEIYAERDQRAAAEIMAKVG